MIMDAHMIEEAVASIRSAVQLTKKLSDSFKTVKSLDKDIAIKQTISELLDALITAQGSAIDAKSSYALAAERIHELEKILGEMKTREPIYEHYELAMWQGGIMAYLPKEGTEAAAKAPHALCANCFDNHKKSFLQATNILHAVKVQCAGCHYEQFIGEF